MDWIILHYLSIAHDSVEQHDSFDPNSLYKYMEVSHSNVLVERLDGAGGTLQQIARWADYPPAHSAHAELY